MYDSFHRPINYLRVSVTDRCNLRCVYCMPEEGVPYIPHSRVLSLEEIAEAVRVAVDLGVHKVRLTGGEPLVRKGIVELVKMLSAIDGIKDLAMTTNGVLLTRYAEKLKRAGLDRVNISLDTMDPEEYRRITRRGDLNEVLEGIKAARRAGLFPIKLNAVIPPNGDRSQALQVAEFAKENGFQARFIQQMNLQAGEFSIVEGGEGGNCARCNRLRLSSEGVVYPCLFSDNGYSIRRFGPREAFLKAVKHKPAQGLISNNNTFYKLGG
ncbi:MAG TPA: GTP 3',8-cyclase MoaA [Sediminispirochaeta sp.]|nr:GTP 3',8-cyclase MoaA [Sediminispirochaeta sp.]